MRAERTVAASTRTSGSLWLAAGALFALAPLFDAPPPAIPVLSLIGRVLVALSIVALAIGIAGQGSVTALRPLGTSALVAFGIVYALAPVLPLLAFDAGWAPLTVNALVHALELALGVVATVQIGRVGVLPAPWNWAPFWTLVAVALAVLLTQLVGIGAGSSDTSLLLASATIAGLVATLAKLFLRVLLILLADRRLRRQAV